MMMTFLDDFLSLRRVVMGDVNGVWKIKQRRQGRSGVKTKRKRKKALKMVCYQMAMNAFTLGGLTLQIMFFKSTFLDDRLSFFLSFSLALRKVFEEGFNGGRFKWVMKK
jgi:hypothetical protein